MHHSKNLPPMAEMGQTRPGRAIGICSHVRYATNSDDQLPNCDPSLRAKGGHHVLVSNALELLTAKKAR